jgi:purine-binding chemotaxis protein CheW
MATRQLATFSLDGHDFGINVDRVQEVLRHHNRTPVPLASPSVGGLLNLRGQVVTTIDLRTRLGLPPLDGDASSMNVVVRVEGEAISLLVDSIGDVVDVDEKLFEQPPDTLDGRGRDLIHGAYKLDGRLLLALDVDRAVAV